ncbi:hypothetical protein [Nocardia sp. NPDC050175]|uniref:hypothetical protein n=1 Tax=Nocardia sp. NPDC050175 TaxID=3364317 RepID=UPI0037B55673
MNTETPRRTVASADHSAPPAAAAPLPGLAAASASCHEFPNTALFAVIALLETRIRALVSDNRHLRTHLRQLTVALDDSLDRESAHALCPHHERLVPAEISSTRLWQTSRYRAAMK